jgi:hypothetical protein
LTDIADGRADRAIARWSAATANSGLPWSGQRRDWGKLLNPQLRDFERNFGGYFRNRNAFLDAGLPNTALPGQVSVVGGRKIGGEISPLQRIINTYTPFKSYDGQHPNELFLIDWMYPIQEKINVKLPNGVELDSTQKNFIAQEMANDKVFQQQLTDTRRYVEKNDLYKQLKSMREENLAFEDNTIARRDWGNVYYKLDQIVSAARSRALTALYMDQPELLQRIQTAGQVKDAATMTDVERLRRLANP